MEVFLTLCVNSLFRGVVYVLSALGVSIPLAYLKFPNFAHGELMVLGAVEVLWLRPLLGAWGAFFAMLFLFALKGFLLYELCVLKLRNFPPHVAFLAMVALSALLVGCIYTFFGVRIIHLSTALEKENFLLLRLNIFLLTASLLASAIFFMNRTIWGIMMKAFLDNVRGARLLGVKVFERELFMTSIVLSGVSGVVVAFLGDFSLTSAHFFTLMAFAISIGGKPGHVKNNLYLGLFMSTLETFSAYFLPFISKSILTFGALLLFILVRAKRAWGHTR